MAGSDNLLRMAAPQRLFVGEKAIKFGQSTATHVRDEASQIKRLRRVHPFAFYICCPLHSLDAVTYKLAKTVRNL